MLLRQPPRPNSRTEILQRLWLPYSHKWISQDCLDKLQAMLVLAFARPKTRKKSRPTLGSRRARLQAKKHRSAVKKQRRGADD